MLPRRMKIQSPPLHSTPYTLHPTLSLFLRLTPKKVDSFPNTVDSIPKTLDLVHLIRILADAIHTSLLISSQSH